MAGPGQVNFARGPAENARVGAVTNRMAHEQRSLAERLGYGPDARLLIVNADDFGLCEAENAATIAGLDQGAFSSATIMVPCPRFADAAAYARSHPRADLGVHLTHTAEWASYRWGPVAERDAVPSLVDADGHLYRTVRDVYDHARLDDVEHETRRQITTALDAGLDVTHLDSHMGTLQLDPAYHDLYVRLAAEFRLPIRMAGRAGLSDIGMGAALELADRLGVLAPDHFHYGGPPHPAETAAYWTGVFRTLTPGVTELYVHAAQPDAEMTAATEGWAQRVADFEFFTSGAARACLGELGVIQIGYRNLRSLQRRLMPC